MKNKFFVLWSAGLVGAAAVLPYAFTLQREIIAKVDKPLSVIILASIAQTAVLLAIAIFFGLKLSRSLNLPVLTPLEPNTSLKDKLRSIALLAVPCGIITAVIIIFGDKLFSQYIPQLTIVNSQMAIWKTLLASLYGGIAEEILTRLFLVSLFAWLIGKLFRSADVIKNNWIMWAAIFAAAILFGLGHLPITSSITQITPLVVVRAIVLNGIGGLVFGWLYWKKGLEYAMAAHFTADIMLLAVLPAILK
ncbi:MAG: CPBP family glutamic-type intramembrane protease [Candidatus Doudnabacteria bacterium]|nr:CPBP family glutamic-type intramembrane protease [Candidatus Doudnabacteria bacterium]